jgi:hypothetical protein
MVYEYSITSLGRGCRHQVSMPYIGCWSGVEQQWMCPDDMRGTLVPRDQTVTAIAQLRTLSRVGLDRLNSPRAIIPVRPDQYAWFVHFVLISHRARS